MNLSIFEHQNPRGIWDMFSLINKPNQIYIVLFDWPWTTKPLQLKM